MKRLTIRVVLLVAVFVCAATLLSSVSCNQSGHVQDEARRVGRTAASFSAADEDYFHDRDGQIALTSDEIRGRNMWLVWTGGDDRFWDVMTKASVGTLDLLKTISDYPSLKATRDNRWNYLGAVSYTHLTLPTI